MKDIFKKIQNWLIGVTDKAVIPVYSAANKLDKFLGTANVEPNKHVGKDIWSHPLTGCYEHKDENGNWVEGPSLGHGYNGGYSDYSKEHKTKLDKWLEQKGIIKE